MKSPWSWNEMKIKFLLLHMLLGGWHWQSWSDRGWDSLFFIHSLHEWLGGGEWVCVCVCGCIMNITLTETSMKSTERKSFPWKLRIMKNKLNEPKGCGVMECRNLLCTDSPSPPEYTSLLCDYIILLYRENMYLLESFPMLMVVCADCWVSMKKRSIGPRFLFINICCKTSLYTVYYRCTLSSFYLFRGKSPPLHHQIRCYVK